MILRFGSHTSNIELAELLYISIKARPGITMANEFQYFILIKVASKNVIVIIPENTYAEITSRQYIDSAIETKKTIEVYRPSAICRDVFCSSKVTQKCQMNILVQSVEINNCSYVKRREKKNCSLYRGHKLFLSKGWFKVVRVNCSIASISLFRINIPLSNKSILFGAKTSRVESDDKVELREVLRPPYLSLDQYLSSRKILKVFIICNNINRKSQIVLSNYESLKNSKKFLVMHVIAQLYYSKSVGVKGNQVNFILFIHNRKDYNESIVRDISFYNKMNIRDLIYKNRSKDKCFL